MKKKGGAPIGPWMKCITNHLWWASENCDGDVEKVKRDWLSLQYHIVNIHKWKVDGKWHECPHEKLSKEKIKKTKWLLPGSLAHVAVIEVISAPKLLKIFCKLTKACHTSQLESFHSLCTKYAPKRQEFDYEIMDARIKMAVMDHNENVGRNQAVINKTHKGSQEIGSKKWKISCSKQTKAWNAKRILQDKTYNFVHSLLVSSVAVKITCPLKRPSTSTRPANIPKNIAPLPMPAREEIIKKREQQEQKQMESMKRVLENEKRVREVIKLKKESSKQKEEGLTKVAMFRKKNQKQGKKFTKKSGKQKSATPTKRKQDFQLSTSTPKKRKLQSNP